MFTPEELANQLDALVFDMLHLGFEPNAIRGLIDASIGAFDYNALMQAMMEAEAKRRPMRLPSAETWPVPFI